MQLADKMLSSGLNETRWLKHVYVFFEDPIKERDEDI